MLNRSAVEHAKSSVTRFAEKLHKIEQRRAREDEAIKRADTLLAQLGDALSKLEGI